MLSKAISVDEALPEDVLKFAEEHDLVEHVEKAIRATREVFTDAVRITVSLKRDPEYGDIQVNVNALIPDGDPDAEAENYSTCLEKWAAFMPPKVIGMISLSTSWLS